MEGKNLTRSPERIQCCFQQGLSRSSVGYAWWGTLDHDVGMVKISSGSCIPLSSEEGKNQIILRTFS